MNKTLLIIIAALILAGCTKSKSNTNTTTSTSITGKWIITADTLREYSNGSLQETDEESVTSADYFQFNTDLSGSTNDAQGAVYIVTYTYKLTGQVINFSYAPQMGAEAYAQSATIQQLTDTKLTILFDDKYTDQGANIEDKEVVYMTKQ